MTHRLVRVTNHDYINAESVCALFRTVAAASVGVPITLVLDNARYQKCALVQALASSLGIELLYLPGYSPNLNLIERLWRFVRKQSLDSIYYEDFAIHGCDRSVPGRSAHSPQGRDGNSNDSQVPDVWRCATIGRVEYNNGSFYEFAEVKPLGSSFLLSTGFLVSRHTVPAPSPPLGFPTRRLR